MGSYIENPEQEFNLPSNPQPNPNCTADVINILKAMTPAQIAAMSKEDAQNISNRYVVDIQPGDFPTYPTLSLSLSTAQFHAFYYSLILSA